MTPSPASASPEEPVPAPCTRHHVRGAGSGGLAFPVQSFCRREPTRALGASQHPPPGSAQGGGELGLEARQCVVQLRVGTESLSFVNTLCRCHSTVRGLRKSRAPISGFDSPSRASRAICRLLRGQLVARLDGACARLARGEQLPPCALCERLHPHRRELVVGGRAVRAHRPGEPLAAQPLAVEQVRARQVHAHLASPEEGERLTVQMLPAVTPELKRARDLASTPSAQSVPARHAISANRRAASPAASGSPRRAAASINSTHPPSGRGAVGVGQSDRLVGGGQGAWSGMPRVL